MEPFGVTVPIPAIVQLVAFVDDRVSVADCPCAIVVGETESIAVGGVGTVTVTEPYVVHDG